MGSMIELAKASPTYEIQKAFIKGYNKIHGYDTFRRYDRIMVSLSGGSDSDIVLDYCERIGYPHGTLKYVFFDTGMEFEATKRHLDFLEKKYGIEICREKAKIPVPLGCKKYGVPFLSKQVSEWIGRLQRHNFQWENESFDYLLEKYPKCKAALRWWCNAWGENSRLNISKQRWLKEFMIENPPDFAISAGCCSGAKKKTAEMIAKKYNPDLDVQGIRKSEGGARSTAYKSCFDETFMGCDKYRPIFWFKNADKEEYEKAFGVTHSDCYTKYGLKRTGCACCPFGSNFEYELSVAQIYEPKLYKAAMNVFGKSYKYARKYREFKEKMDSGQLAKCEQ